MADAVAPVVTNANALNDNVHAVDKEKEWLNTVKDAVSKEVLESNDFISWAAYHASKQPPLVHLPAIISLLPMFKEQAHSVCIILHSMNVVKQAVNLLNKGQPPVIVLDQPFYALAKQIQWNWPSTHGESKFVIMLGALHIEMTCFKVLGDWLDGSGRTAVLEAAEVKSSGVADSFLKASHLTRTRRAHQITAAVLFILQGKAYAPILKPFQVTRNS